MLPADFERVVHDGIVALRWIEAKPSTTPALVAGRAPAAVAVVQRLEARDAIVDARRD